jgi:magnesium chelatase subunit D
MEFAKGAVLGLLEASFKHRDEVALVAFRATAANIVVRPTRNIEEVHAAIQYMPTGGRTPLATAFEVARELVTEQTILIVVTDGKANVPIHSGDAWQDALSSAATMRCPALVIDSEVESEKSGRAKVLASALGATYVRLDAIEHAVHVRLSETRMADVAS